MTSENSYEHRSFVKYFTQTCQRSLNALGYKSITKVVAISTYISTYLNSIYRKLMFSKKYHGRLFNFYHDTSKGQELFHYHNFRTPCELWRQKWKKRVTQVQNESSIGLCDVPWQNVLRCLDERMQLLTFDIICSI